MLFFTSDLHFDDEGILKTDNRPFKNCKQFNNFVFKTWNKQATKNDTIYVIGDFLDCDNEKSDLWKKAIHYVRKIKAKVVLVVGNNEERVIKYFFDGNFEKFRDCCLNCGFKDVVKNATLNINGQEFFLTHKPKHCKVDALNLFGHTHRASGIYFPFGFNVGCDLSHFRLLSEEDIKWYMYMKEKYWDKDQNLLMRFHGQNVEG